MKKKTIHICCVLLVLAMLLGACHVTDESFSVETTTASPTGMVVTAGTVTNNTTTAMAAPTPTSTVSAYPEILSWDTLYPIQNNGNATLVSSTAGGMTKETAENLFDGDLSTKLCTNTTGYTIVWKLNQAYDIPGYSIHTANDNANYGRLPEKWVVEASLDGKNWATVSDVSHSAMRRSNFTEYFYAFSKPGEYRYFRFTLNAPVSQMTQFSEITLYTRELPLQENNTHFTSNLYGTAGMELLKQTISDYYDRASHTLRGQPDSSDACAVWAAAAFTEALAEAYRLCPEDRLIYGTYVDVLNHCLTTYKVNSSIQTPSGTWNVSYYNATKGNTGDYYYDDDAWICIQYLNAYTLLGDVSYLKRAEEILAFLWTGWDEKLGGGIYWDKSFQGKNTCANGPAAIAFLSAYEMTGKQEYLTKGKQIYDWCRSTLLEGNLYSDAIGLNGSINGWKAAYNQGTMLCVGSMLYRITGQESYLTQTRLVYHATVSHMFRGSGSNVSMIGNPIYKAWCIGWLERGFLMFQEVAPDKTTEGISYLKKVLDKTLKTKNESGYYDPYFCTGDWTGESTTDVLQPSGVACVFLLAGLSN